MSSRRNVSVASALSTSSTSSRTAAEATAPSSDGPTHHKIAEFKGRPCRRDSFVDLVDLNSKQKKEKMAAQKSPLPTGTQSSKSPLLGLPAKILGMMPKSVKNVLTVGFRRRHRKAE